MRFRFIHKAFLLLAACLVATFGLAGCSGSASDGGVVDNPIVQGGDTGEVSATDSDGDGIADATDNCPNDVNEMQLDTDGDGIGDVCDPADDTSPNQSPPEVVIYTEEEEVSVDFFAGFYTWTGSTEGLTTEKFISEAGISLYDTLNTELPDETLMAYANAADISIQPARNTYSYGVTFYQDPSNGKKFVYYIDSSCGLKRVDVANGLVQDVAANLCLYGDWDGLGTSARMGFSRSVAIADADISSLGIKAGDVLVADYSKHKVRKVRVTETSNGPVALMTALALPTIQYPYYITMKDGIIYVETRNTSNVCTALYKISGSGSATNITELIAAANLPASCSGMLVVDSSDYNFPEGSGIVEGHNIFLAGNKTLKHFDANGNLIGAITNSAALTTSPSNPVMLSDGSALLIGTYITISTVSFPIGSSSTITPIVGGASYSWMEFNSDWDTLNTPNNMLMNWVQTISIDESTNSIYLSDQTVRRIDCSTPTTCTSSTTLTGITNVYSAASDNKGDGTDPNDARFRGTSGLLYVPADEGGPSDFLFVGDLNHHALRKISIDPTTHAFQEISSAFTATFISGAIVDESGNLYYRNVTDYSTIKKTAGDPLGLHGPVTVGATTTFFSNADVAGFGLDYAFLTNGGTILGNYMYIPDAVNEVIYKVSLDKTEISIFAGMPNVSGTIPYNVPTPLNEAMFYGLSKAKALNGKIYVQASSTQQIYVIEGLDTETPTIRLISGCGSSVHIDGTGAEACFATITDYSVLGNALIVIDMNDRSVRRVDLTTLEVTTLAGYPGRIYYKDGNKETSAFERPVKIECVESMKRCFVGETNAVRVISGFQ